MQTILQEEGLLNAVSVALEYYNVTTLILQYSRHLTGNIELSI